MAAEFDLLTSLDEQNAVWLEAKAVFIERNDKYKDLWRQMSKEDMLTMMRHKLARVAAGVEPRDDVLDLINYAVFYVRNGYAD